MSEQSGAALHYFLHFDAKLRWVVTLTGDRLTAGKTASGTRWIEDCMDLLVVKRRISTSGATLQPTSQ
jgi:hypothetical protein